MLLEVGILECKAADMPMDSNVKLICQWIEHEVIVEGAFIGSRKAYKLVRKLNYLTINRPNIAYLVSIMR